MPRISLQTLSDKSMDVTACFIVCSNISVLPAANFAWSTPIANALGASVNRRSAGYDARVLMSASVSSITVGWPENAMRKRGFESEIVNTPPRSTTSSPISVLSV